jgi:predicted transport protein
MGDIKLFHIDDGAVNELEGGSVALEKSLQTLFENNLVALLGVRFLASEFPTTHGGRMDTLGIDENNCPVIIEYKRATNENVVNQGLFYLDWLMDHRRDYEWLVLKTFGQEAAENVEWSAPRLMCIAGDFTKYDAHAVNQMNRNIELIRYAKFGNDLLMLDLITASQARAVPAATDTRAKTVATTGTYRTVATAMEDADAAMMDRFEALKAFLMALGDDVQMQILKYYIAFKRIKNFVCVEFYTREQKLIVTLKVDPDTVTIEPGFTRDVRNIGHIGTGDLELTIRSDGDMEKAKPLLVRSYEAS